MWKKNKVLILDIRTPMEYEDHHIPGALLVPMDYLDVLLHKIPHKEIAVFCEHGNRARYATYGMPDLWKGRKVYYVIGGMAGWMGMGYEVESGIDENGVKWQKWLEELTNS
jgi:Rhodanese-related sulfurtransferase